MQKERRQDRRRTARGQRSVAADRELSRLECSVLLTVLYADLFDFPLTPQELAGRLVGAPRRTGSLDAALEHLTRSFLRVVDGYVVWKGSEHLVAVRKRRRKAAGDLWKTASRYAGWLSRIPFIRMVAVSGSLAVANADRTSDVDLFCITTADRLWVARLFMVPLSKLTRYFPKLFPTYLCPNYILAMDGLAVPDRNLFTAHEVSLTVPIWGHTAYGHFRDANAWVGEYIPLAPGWTRGDDDRQSQSVLTRVLERALSGRAGNRLNAAAHRMFVSFYRRRADRNGWNWSAMEGAYQIHRYTVPEGGYVRVVRDLFAERVRERLGDGVHLSEIDALFPNVAADPTCIDWVGLFSDEYGPGAKRAAVSSSPSL